MAKKLTVYFRSNMKAIIDSDKVVFVFGNPSMETIWKLLENGLRIIRWESVNYVKEEVVQDDPE